MLADYGGKDLRKRVSFESGIKQRMCDGGESGEQVGGEGRDSGTTTDADGEAEDGN